MLIVCRDTVGRLGVGRICLGETRSKTTTSTYGGRDQEQISCGWSGTCEWWVYRPTVLPCVLILPMGTRPPVGSGWGEGVTCVYSSTGSRRGVRDWSLITGRGGGAKKWVNHPFNVAKTSSYRVKTTPKLGVPPPPFSIAKTCCAPPPFFVGVKLHVTPPPPFWSPPSP